MSLDGNCGKSGRMNLIVCMMLPVGVVLCIQLSRFKMICKTGSFDTEPPKNRQNWKFRHRTSTKHAKLEVLTWKLRKNTFKTGDSDMDIGRELKRGQCRHMFDVDFRVERCIYDVVVAVLSFFQ